MTDQFSARNPPSLYATPRQETKRDEEYPELNLQEAPAQNHMDSSLAANADGDEGEEPCCECPLSGPRLDERNIMSKGKWCCYCCCGGVGCIPWTKTKEDDAPCHCSTKCICVEHVCEMVEHDNLEGVCGSVQTCCYCTPMLQLPPPEGLPRCMCCGVIYGGIKRTDATHNKEVTVEDDPIALFEHVVYNHNQPCFCGFCGCGFQPFFQECYDAYFKCSCCRYSTKTLAPCEAEEVSICRLLLNAGLCIAQCRFPCKFAGSPVVACCGKPCKKHLNHAPGVGLGA